MPAGSLDRFWDRSNYHAIVCGRLARYLRSISADGAYTFGLFNDCGIPILIQRFPDYKETLRLANQSEQSFVAIENERHHTSHALVGAILARSWHLPEIICKAIGDHHSMELLSGTPPAVEGDVSALCAISLIADYIVNDFLHVKQEAEWAQYGAQAMAYLGLGEDELAELRSDIDEELEETHAYRL